MGDFPDFAVRSFSSGSSHEDLKISVTASDSSDSFATEVRSLLFYNDGANGCHINIDAAATTGNFYLPAKSSHSIDIPCTTAHAICATGESCTLYVRGIR